MPPINIPDKLPAKKILENENIFVMTEHQAHEQNIRPLQIGILNLMPTKIETETQLLRLLGNSPLQVEITLLQTASYKSKNTPSEHLAAFYKTFDNIKNDKFDGLVITGAPVETMAFEDVAYWKELTEIMDWSKTNVFSTLYICWGAQAGLYYHYGIGKYSLPQKLSGIYEHRLVSKTHKLVRGFDEIFLAPHSRYTDVRIEDVEACSKLDVLALSDRAGLYLAADQSGRRIFVTGHSEYDVMTLADEYTRDAGKGMSPVLPYNYFPGDDPAANPPLTWRSHSNLLFANWLNYFVYQQTPYDLNKIK